ncbi:MAG: restriction endonuclease subunit M [Prevotella sp.]|nr:restriction endonuclease subunit M [Prevotella sp.]
MDKQLIRTIYEQITQIPNYQKVLEFIDFDYQACTGRIKYNSTNIDLTNSSKWYKDGFADIHDEECVRAWLVVCLYFKYKYLGKRIIGIEKEYKAVGRPGKGGIVDVYVKNPDGKGIFLFIECKSPSEYDAKFHDIDGQLFRLSRQEIIRPKYLLYYSTKVTNDSLSDRILLIDVLKFEVFDEWMDAGAPALNSIPVNYGKPQKKFYANIENSTEEYNALDDCVTSSTFASLNYEIHDVIWGGGGTSNNEIFVYIVKLLLCKIYDEQETSNGQIFKFQRLTTELGEIESAEETFARMNDLYKIAEKEYLALDSPTNGPAFELAKISASKIAYVVGKLEGISIIRNKYSGDLLGDFFENIVSQDYTQSRGQFFTPIKLVKFMLMLSNCEGITKNVLLNDKDNLGRYRLPYIIDPSCGTGTFLIEYMKLITQKLASDTSLRNYNKKIKEATSIWFDGDKKTNWAKEYIYAIEYNYDLGIAAKVNMVLHGDGCMNTWIENGLYSFSKYFRDKRTNILGFSEKRDTTGYSAETNNQFDLILSNPPFSIKNSPDEKKEIEKAFSDTFKVSEVLFIERWYQLLREGGVFCCILPENILDTSTSINSRKFLLKYFKLKAIVSLPYDAFKPFTSTKTCIVLAEKKSDKDVAEWNDVYGKLLLQYNDVNIAFAKTLSKCANENNLIFMAEPQNIGYKRRKNLPDLVKANDLYQEDFSGDIDVDINNPVSVLDFYYRGYKKGMLEQLDKAFYIRLSDITKRESLRLDPKYLWFWNKQNGIVEINNNGKELIGLNEFIHKVELQKIQKGALNEETIMIDLESVLPRKGKVSSFENVFEIGSDKVSFSGADIMFSKLEPYLGKVIIEPLQNAIGSTEWVGYSVNPPYKANVIGFLLMHEKLCRAYRMLQSGKRHARLNPEELEEIKIRINKDNINDTLASLIKDKENNMLSLESQMADIRSSIDKLFES